MPENLYLQFLEKYNIVRNHILKIPTSYTDYKNGKLPRKVSLRDRFGNMWPVGVTKTGRDSYFQYGWEKFIEENTLEFGDFLIFDYDGNGTFDFKLLGRTGCEKKGVGGLKLAVEEEEEINEHQKSVEPKGKNLASDSNNSSSFDDSDDDDKVEEEEEDERYEVVVEQKEEDDEEVEEEDNKRAGTFKKKASRSKAGCKRAAAHKVRDRHDQFGADIFKSGRATQPKNPYFVGKLRSNKQNQMHVPGFVMKDYKLELPSSMTIRDFVGRELVTKCKRWKDGRICLVGGWHRLSRWNLMEINDKFICEFVRGEHNKGLYVRVQVIHEGASSHSNKKNKK